VDVFPKGPVAFSCHTLDLPFTDKGIQAFRLKVNRASGQSVVRRHTRVTIVFVICVVIVLFLFPVVFVCFGLVIVYVWDMKTNNEENIKKIN